MQEVAWFQFVFHSVLAKYSNQYQVGMSYPGSFDSLEGPWRMLDASFVIWGRACWTIPSGGCSLFAGLSQASALALWLCVSFCSVVAASCCFLGGWVGQFVLGGCCGSRRFGFSNKMRISPAHGMFTGFCCMHIAALHCSFAVKACEKLPLLMWHACYTLFEGQVTNAEGGEFAVQGVMIGVVENL